ncbi:hypothetical protein ACFYKX_10440 [Cytobacillus sp. FJAT-54145]|uniref:Uncharacterized protein n=1 Tax=Cytobacillus spartinae TaxID=3299023 RepID=A0ABW6KA09_9BACI
MKRYTCECCGFESSQYKKRFVGHVRVEIKSVKACKKCNWFLTDDEEEKKQVMELYHLKV